MPVDDGAQEVAQDHGSRPGPVGDASLLAQLSKKEPEGAEERGAAGHAKRVPHRAVGGRTGSGQPAGDEAAGDGGVRQKKDGRGGTRRGDADAAGADQLHASGLLLAAGESDGEDQAGQREEQQAHETDLESNDPADTRQIVATPVEDDVDLR